MLDGSVCGNEVSDYLQCKQKGGYMMDQIRIGKFIAESRKSRNLTQRQLADVLSISDKTISKWECGKGLPEVSLMLPLCAALDITVNDLLSGEKVSSTDYQKKAEGNMMNLMKENEENRKRMALCIITVAITVIAVCAYGGTNHIDCGCCFSGGSGHSSGRNA